MSTVKSTNIAHLSSSTNNIVLNSSGHVSITNDLSFNSGYGSAVKAYGCRAWVNFNGTGTVAIRANANVSGITDNGTGDYTLAFSPVFSDADYIGTCGTSYQNAGVNIMVESSDATDGTPTLKSTSEIQVNGVTDANNRIDLDNQYWNFIR